MGKATEPPKCKNCGQAHRGPCFNVRDRSAVFGDGEGKTIKAKSVVAKAITGGRVQKVIVPAPNNPHGDPERREAVRTTPAKRGRGRPLSESPKSKRVTYQRLLMRRLRAAEKAKKLNESETP